MPDRSRLRLRGRSRGAICRASRAPRGPLYAARELRITMRRRVSPARRARRNHCLTDLFRNARRATVGLSARIASLVAVQVKKNLSADAERRCTQSTQMARRGSQAMGHAFDLQARLAEIKPQAMSQTDRFQIIGALHSPPGSSAPGRVRVVQCFDGLQLGHSLPPRRRGSLIGRSTKSRPPGCLCSPPWRRIVARPIGRRHGLHMPTRSHRPFPRTPPQAD